MIKSIHRILYLDKPITIGSEIIIVGYIISSKTDERLRKSFLENAQDSMKDNKKVLDRLAKGDYKH